MAGLALYWLSKTQNRNACLVKFNSIFKFVLIVSFQIGKAVKKIYNYLFQVTFVFLCNLKLYATFGANFKFENTSDFLMKGK